jgi:hypothetical protein
MSIISEDGSKIPFVIIKCTVIYAQTQAFAEIEDNL